MQLLGMEEAEARVGLGAMVAVAASDGDLATDEAALLQAAAQVYDLEIVPTDVTMEQAASTLKSAESRERVIQAMILMALMDGRVMYEELDTIDAWARHLGVEEPRVKNLTQLAGGQLTLLWCDLARHSPAREVFQRRLSEAGLAGLWEIVGPMIGMARDEELAQKYIALGELPLGTFGRAYFDFIRDNDLGFPGEDHAVPEAGLWHDLTHVLAGYDTSPAGEVMVVAFIAGYEKVDPFFWLFTIALQFHLGIRLSPYSKPAKGLFEPDAVLAALRRGAQMNTDISRGWDPWPHFARPLEEVRAELGVPPR